MPTAWMRTRIWPSPGVRSGTSAIWRTSGSPNCWTRIAFMIEAEIEVVLRGFFSGRVRKGERQRSFAPLKMTERAEDDDYLLCEGTFDMRAVMDNSFAL